MTRQRATPHTARRKSQPAMLVLSSSVPAHIPFIPRTLLPPAHSKHTRHDAPQHD